MSKLKAVLPQADFVALTGPLTSETQSLIDADALRHEAARVSSQCGSTSWRSSTPSRRQIRGAALDVTAEEPLPAASPL
jgi:phosphoglycerate dehydrogenase-like enzyme